ncbi:glucan 1,6-alpha-glucosidase [Lapidilactobacillus dextrinicus DSM 20335]|uniref:Glucan 1,6-alpha-glucosidase n=1 Tax=Lapidilactobacillus dextrinicus DSM 20335 TaxID=1423738 RepID=A0A0R2BJR3_9LACO|nr:alpha-glucosidase [Lapidilactobacillus dextrinicus]KRM79601.1 glucan 1,6-alpha-glucosidase [Lapidilactobacillus dextrinicus DSM 20335]QFG47391.1 alpha-glucosidase [Lapidilactobacillus dextrinicus]
MEKTQPWWKTAVVYQIYPRSFQDSNGDGIGDIPGIISRLDYLQFLGIQAIWLCPVYQSPNTDNGYDISNYEAILSDFGTMKDMEKLIRLAKQKGIRIIMDLVLNHTSDQHHWFVEAQKSKENPYRDYYVWADPINNHAPNQLGSIFGGRAWKYDRITNQYYLHLFSEQQPDLNWENQKMRTKIYQMINFWIQKGVGGFRLDVIDLIGKKPLKMITGNGPKLHNYLKEMNRSVFAEKDLMTVGEAGSATVEDAKKYSGPDRNELSMVFQFEHLAIDQQLGKEKWDLAPLNLEKLKQVFVKWQVELAGSGWNSLFWNNHDQPRIVSRWGNDKQYRVVSAKMLAILLHMMQGTPYIYQGEEIGMTNRPITDISEADDIETINMYQQRLNEGYSKQAILASINAKGRDNARTPIQWNDELNAGFTTGKPWLAVNQNYQVINIAAELANENSIFYTYQKLIKLRKSNPILSQGNFKLLEDTKTEVFAYYRQLENAKWLVVCNFSDQINEFNLTDDVEKVIISDYSDLSLAEMGKNISLQLRPYEAFVVAVKA